MDIESFTQISKEKEETNNPMPYGRGSIFIPSWLLDCFRVIFLILHLIFIILPLEDGVETFEATLKFLTMWGYYMTTAYFLLSLIFKITKWDQYVSKHMRLLFFLALYSEFVIAFFFWAVLYPLISPAAKNDHQKFLYEYLYPHTMPFLSIWLDYAFNTWKTDETDGVAEIIFGTIYLAFNCAYTLFSGTPIYKPITYKDLLSYIYIEGAYALAIISYFISLFYTLKVKDRIIKTSEKLLQWN